VCFVIETTAMGYLHSYMITIHHCVQKGIVWMFHTTYSNSRENGKNAFVWRVASVVKRRVRPIDKLDEACTNVPDRMMLVRHRSGKEASAPLHMRACTSAYAFFAESMHAFWKRIMSTMHVQVCMLDRCCEHLRTHLLHARYRMCICAHACAVCFILCWGNEDEDVQLAYEGTFCLAWGVIFDRRKDRGVVCVFYIFNAGGVYVGVYTHTHTHTLHRWVTLMWAQGSRWDTWRARRIQMDQISAYVYSYMCKKYTCVCIC